ncbi:solute carrier family 17 member 9-like [Biomphalaria glabrata]|uniref:Solute carrier family 17 member 9-like n=1 Tax=Biomphalaria glabrata TaxID=6526 RepID=A0A2C9L3B8_BIOGL|nr:solute carrier family 17 member 9-like [Biomphalaria glabrata]XP_013079706.1 solute carrier family 17 member 9-like [Biomphalaria glabrata]XP_055886824.1 solute carrier family 17 member 9-like [Biomphalaria glabrata]XP_055886826.1 solute carrier family 17 member 9-like [Biomphalaria glabrata]XP_055886827.1 solute carrier family 17 member 9-like [Biomphalaria glabrata]XP_055886828.1 solute carrier family 17 member 9-like [Biomphalaria glabrata]KAI8754105.1 solute carrier family 17 member 9-
MATVVTDRDDEYFKECKVEVAGKKTRTHVNLDGVFWTNSEKNQWLVGLFIGTAMLYSARTLMPLCVVPLSEEMGWDKTESGTVLSAFFWGYTMTQFLGGYLSDRIGGELVLPVAACVWSLITFWTPQLAYLSTDKHNSLYIVVLSRVLLGISQGFHFPGMTSIISRKVSEHQRSFLFSVVASGSHFGTLIVGSMGSVLMDYFGWSVPFYIIGLIGLSWMLLMRYMLMAKQRSRSVVSHKESLSLDNDKFKPEPRTSVPWVYLFTKPAFWSILVGHFCENNAFFILLSWIPTYFHENFPTAKGWVFNVVPWVVTIPSSIGSGWLADKMITKGYSVTFVRKTMETVALCGTAFFLFMISYASSYTSCLIVMALAVACCGFHNSGIFVNPQDIAPKHAGSIFGIMNMAGAIPGFVGVYIAGHILEVTKSWNAVFSQTAVICLVGWAAFTLFGTGKKIV